MPSTPPPNLWRGELAIMLDGQQYMLRPSFQALCAIEQQLDTGLFALAAQVQEGQVSLHTLVTIIACCYCGMQPPPVWEDALLRNGLAAAVESVTQLLLQVFEGYCDAING